MKFSILILLAVLLFAIFKKGPLNYTLPSNKDISSGCNLSLYYESPLTKDEFKVFYEGLKYNISHKQWDKVATQYLSFPFIARSRKYNKKSQKYDIRELKLSSQSDFKNNTDQLFNQLPELKEFEEMDFFCNDQGVMIFNGHLWFNIDKNKKVYIKSINFTLS